MDIFGIQLLMGVGLIILIVFPGSVSPALKLWLDTAIGRAVAVAIVIALTQFGGWPMGVMAALAVLLLLPTSAREGFVGHEGFLGGGDKLQVVPTERRQRWFIERVMQESPQEIETNTVNTQAIN
jgi:hypothetical protein